MTPLDGWPMRSSDPPLPQDAIGADSTVASEIPQSRDGCKGIEAGWIEDCLLVLQKRCSAEFNAPREFRLFWMRKTSLASGEALPSSVPVHVSSFQSSS